MAHVIHMWSSKNTCDFSHVFHMWNFTCEISHVKFHMWNTCELSYVKSHMLHFLCETLIWISCAILCQSSQVKIDIWYSPCEFSKVKFLMASLFSCEIPHMTSTYAVIHVAFKYKISNAIFHIWKSHVKSLIWKVSYKLSHVEFHSLLTCHMWSFTCEISHVKFHALKYVTCGISHVKFHMWNFTCEKQVTREFHM